MTKLVHFSSSMASQDEETKRMMRTLIEQQAEMIKLMRLTTIPSPNPSFIPRPTFLSPSRPTFRYPPPTHRPQIPSAYHHQSPPTFHPRPPPRPSQPHHGSKPHQSRPAKARPFTNLWKPVSEVLIECINKGILMPLPPQPLRYPLSPSFDPSRHCGFHQIMGHSTNDCRKLKNAIQDLIDGGVLIPPKDHVNPTSATIPQPPAPSTTHAQGGGSTNPTRKRKRCQG